MKTFEQLSKIEQAKAIQACFANIVESIVLGIVEVKLTNPRNQEWLERILDLGKATDETRLTILRIMNCKPISEELRGLAVIAAEEYLYNAVGSRIMKESLQ